jgi:hypothetical protein
VVMARTGPESPWAWMTPAAGEVLETYDPVVELRGRRRSLTREDVEVLAFAEKTIGQYLQPQDREAIEAASLFVYRDERGKIARVGWAVTLPTFEPIRT